MDRNDSLYDKERLGNLIHNIFTQNESLYIKNQIYAEAEAVRIGNAIIY